MSNSEIELHMPDKYVDDVNLAEDMSHARNLKTLKLKAWFKTKRGGVSERGHPEEGGQSP